MARKKIEKLPEGVRLLPSGRYQARYPVEDSGARRLVPVSRTFTNARDAADARAFELAKIRNGTWVDPSGAKMLLRDWSAVWLSLNRGGNTKTQSFLRARILPQWGDHRLGDITKAEVMLWVNAMIEEDLAPLTIHGIYSTFARMMRDAVEHDRLGKTPCRGIDLPKKKARKKKLPLSVAELKALEDGIAPRYRALIHLATWAGLRWGECAALRWDDVDLQSGILHVRRSGRRDTTKNGEERFVQLAPESVEVLREHRRDFGTATFVFTTEHHKVQLAYADFRKRVWLPLVAGMTPAPTFHALRHAHATHMVAKGVDWKVLADSLGHHAPSFTMDTYGLPRADAGDVMVTAIQAAMRGE